MAHTTLHQRQPQLIIGQRYMPHAPWRSRLGRWWSNTTGSILAGQQLGDSQSGLRVYPLPATLRLNSRRQGFAFEIEVLVLAAWAGIRLRSHAVSVWYGSERVSHFKPVTDNRAAVGCFADLARRRWRLPARQHRQFQAGLAPDRQATHFIGYGCDTDQRLPPDSLVAAGELPLTWTLRQFITVFLANCLLGTTFAILLSPAGRMAARWLAEQCADLCQPRSLLIRSLLVPSIPGPCLILLGLVWKLPIVRQALDILGGLPVDRASPQLEIMRKTVFLAARRPPAF